VEVKERYTLGVLVSIATVHRAFASKNLYHHYMLTIVIAKT